MPTTTKHVNGQLRNKYRENVSQRHYFDLNPKMKLLLRIVLSIIVGCMVVV